LFVHSGGAHKYANDWERELGIVLTKQDEMDSLVAGMQFVIGDIIGECFTFKPSDWTPQPSPDQDQVIDGSLYESHQQLRKDEISSKESAATNGSTTGGKETFATSDTKDSMQREDSSDSEASRPRTDHWWTSKKVKRDNVIPSDLYPYLLVSIGTGVSILRVDGPRKHERISGSTIGGGTYWGLCRLLTGSDSFKDILDLASRGDSSKVDMMVGDIYGKESKALEKIGLSSDIVASSFGKLVANQHPSKGIKEEDLARALLLMVTNNIGQVAHLNAKLHKTRKIYFIGTFLQHNVISQQRLAYSIDYWSQGTMEAQFLEHEVSWILRIFCVELFIDLSSSNPPPQGYFGALGAFLLNQGIEHGGSPRVNINGNKIAAKQPRKRRTESVVPVSTFSPE
jgi:pantothenate kinase